MSQADIDNEEMRQPESEKESNVLLPTAAAERRPRRQTKNILQNLAELSEEDERALEEAAPPWKRTKKQSTTQVIQPQNVLSLVSDDEEPRILPETKVNR